VYTDEKPADPIVLWVYTGADGEFTLYEDDGVTYGYEKGAFARIPIRWNEATRTLTIAKREGSYPGMQKRAHVRGRAGIESETGRFSFAPKADRAFVRRCPSGN